MENIAELIPSPQSFKIPIGNSAFASNTLAGSAPGEFTIMGKYTWVFIDLSLPYLFEYAPNLKLAPNTNKRPS